MKESNNIFAGMLQKVLLYTGMKNYVIAKALKYDVSYISKWVSGKAVPSKRNIEEICAIIGKLVIENCNEEEHKKLRNYIGGDQNKPISEVVEAKLREAYYDTIGELSSEAYANNGSVRINPTKERCMLTDFKYELESETTLNVAVMADLFELDHSTKLSLSGIEDNSFVMSSLHKDVNVNFVVDLSKINGKSVYDVILLIHLLTGYSLSNFNLTQSNNVDGKLVIAIENKYAAITMLNGNQGFFATATTRDREAVNQAYRNIISHDNSEKMVFSKTSMESMLIHHEYIASMLSGEIKWLIGHVTEQLISPELACRLESEIFENSKEIIAESKIARSISEKLVANSNVRALVYDSALTNFMLTGVLDFYNHKVILEPQDRIKQLKYIRGMVDRSDSERMQFRLIQGGFSEDFRYITNPCVFLSDTVSYLRLENKNYINNILLVLDKDMRKILDEFFEEIWENRKDVVIDDRNTVLLKLDKSIEACGLLSNVN